MTPIPQEPVQQEAPSGDRVVISGMSGLYPNSRNVQDLADILYNKVNPVSADHKRWTYNHPETAQYIGAAPDLKLFDSQFFKVHLRLGTAMDPMARKMLEESYKAIYDAGLSPEHLSGKKVGVYIGTCFSETEKACFYVASTRTGFGIAGCSKTMFANRISYWLNAKGPSHAIDQSCCSSTAAVEEAYKAIKRGECEAAIAGGCSLCLHPQSSIHYGRITKLCMDGKTKSYDQNASGFARSDAVAVVFLQKAQDALRIYAEVVHVKNEFIGIKDGKIGPKFGFDRNTTIMANFIKKVYDEAGIPPSVVEYVEGFGSADPEADKSELEAIATVFKRDQKHPLLLGSVMSNIGYTEAASGIAAITKVLLAYHRGELAGNLHLETPRQDVEALRVGQLKVLKDHQKFRRSYTAINGLSTTGVNSHILLHGNYKPKNFNRYKSSIPRLVTLSARMDTAVEQMLEQLKSGPVDPEQLALLHNIHSNAISGHLGRGYIILDSNAEKKTISLSERVDYFDDVKRPLVFVYSGMGSQWAGMGAQLMKIPIFAAAIERCNRVLQPKGIDVSHIITSPEKSIFDNILHSFVGIAAIQIGLTDVLRAIDLVPDFIIGHSVGELGCAYADGCFTAEEMILSAYLRGLVSKQTPFIKGSMAAVGIGYQKIKDMCPSEIEVACHNGPDSCTISGPQEAMKRFVGQLTDNKIFAKEVPCSNIAYHSRYIAEAGPTLRKYLSEVIKSPKARSNRWLSSSVPENKWNEPSAKYSSAEYHTNNLLNPVLFEETSRLLPRNGVMVEIAPHGLLQAILKRSLPDTCTHIPLTQREHPDNTLHMLEAIGKLYLAGYVPKVNALYPKVEFPVSTGTPFLSNLVHWMHSETWGISLYMSAQRNKIASCKFVVSIHDDDYNFLQGNVVNGKIVYPYAAALVAVWDTLAMSTEQKKKQLTVQFSDIHLYAQPMLHDRRYLRIHVNLHRGTGMFEVLDGDSLVATGYIVRKIVPVKKNIVHQIPKYKGRMLKSDEVYQVLKNRNFFYSGEFRSIYDVSGNYNKAHMLWNNNWTTFIDSLLQLYTLQHDYDGVSEPRLIRSLSIDVKDHLKNILHTDKMSLIEANFVPEHDLLCCGGVMLENVVFRDLPPVAKQIVIKQLNLVSNIKSEESSATLAEKNYLLGTEESSTSSVVSLKCMLSGALDSLQWVEQPLLKGTGIPVTVHYCSFNHRDAVKTIGVSNYENLMSYAMEFSGVTDSGERVMGLLPTGAASTRVLAIPELLWPVPEHWTLEDAATVPLAYAQAIYCLLTKMAIVDTSSVLVHCGTGGLGQAAINVALAHHYRVFATVSTEHKKRFLLRLFPELDEKDIGYSRDESFADMVMTRTKGKGCSKVISCVEGALKNATLRIPANNGSTFDFSQISNTEDYNFGMSHLTQDRSYYVMDASTLFEDLDVTNKIQTLIADGISSGYVVPLTRIVFPPNEAVRALALVAAGKHRGRVLLKMDGFHIKGQPKIACSPDHCHLIITDDYDCGLQWVKRLVNRGVKKLQVHCSTMINNALSELSIWHKKGVNLGITSDEDLKSSKGVLGLLNNCVKAGPVEGIYVIATGKISQKTLDYLDVMTRKLCPSLKYFAVISDDISLGRQTCTFRAQEGLPATKLIVPIINKIKSFSSSHLDGIETALRSKDVVLIADSQEDAESSILVQIASIAEIEIPADVDGNTTLEGLGLSDLKLKPLYKFMRDTYSICYNANMLKSLTVNRLKNLELSVKQSEFQEVKRLENFFLNVDSDELLATTEMVFLPTIGSNSTMRADEFDTTQTYLCIVPGLEGHNKRFQVLCERLKLPALVLQPGLDHLQETIHEIAQRYAELLLKKTSLTSNFYLMGYESGVMIALSMAAILEEHGITGTVYCIGATPEGFKATLEKELQIYDTEEDLQVAVAQHMFSLMGGDTKRLTDLNKYRTWDEKIQACVRTLVGQVPHSAQYAQSLIKAAYVRIIQARNYKPKPLCLRSQIVFARAANQQGNLQMYSEKPVIVYDLKAPLSNAAADLRCSNIINRHLDRSLIEAFNDKNTCDSYLTNSDIYMVAK